MSKATQPAIRVQTIVHVVQAGLRSDKVLIIPAQPRSKAA